MHRNGGRSTIVSGQDISIMKNAFLGLSNELGIVLTQLRKAEEVFYSYSSAMDASGVEMKTLQDVDKVIQTIDVLEKYAREMEQTLEMHGGINSALEKIVLEDVRKRLSTVMFGGSEFSMAGRQEIELF